MKDQIKLSIAILTAAFSGVTFADDATLSSHDAVFRLGYETIKLPGDEHLGLLGGTYLIETIPGLYVGPAAYGAVSGQRGGFFTGGWETAWRQPIYSRLMLEAGLYVGGGGGAAAPVGGGLMLRPHVDLTWAWGRQRAGLSLSQVYFPNGDIRSNQLGVVWSLDDPFNFTAAGNAGKSLLTDQRGGVGFDRIGVRAGGYRPKDGGENIGFAGVDMQQVLANGWLWGIEAAGAASGGADGYAEVLGYLGWETPVIGNSVYLGARAALGAGGGGAIDTKGGVLAKAAVFSRVALSRDLSLLLEGGLADAPQGSFRAWYGSAQLQLALDHPETGLSTAKLDGWRWGGSVQRYSSAQRRSGESKPLDTIGLRIERDLAQGFYLTGQAHSAFAGDAGAYSVGLFGAGWQSSFASNKLVAGAELTAGAAGGGGVSSEGGAITQPMVFLGYNVTPGWQLRGSAGRVMSIKGELSSPVYDLSLMYQFGLPKRP
ncbi:hypothetical protein JHS3_00820 [Jeongeupia sp. HS-3]|uniref:hypothetical protein n=1 Tax=Jeongeupia sp. HS-3 TaxID=1009682 RepID=UPI0018A4A60F|nr:hypothetical protein [Jeongeupia sp. HS-3]BCL74346.1 hypothetical protein JHS3_00820 [Jeongeupia sp. HS-3]